MAEWVEDAIVNSAFAELRFTIDTISYGGGCDSRRDKVAAFYHDEYEEPTLPKRLANTSVVSSYL
jgi:hypothetical protein